MAHSEQYVQIASLFFPDLWEAQQKIELTNGRFAHYTSAAVAMSIIQEPFIWMRNAITMNDFSEVKHGKACIIPAFNDEGPGRRILEFLESFFPGLAKDFLDAFNSWIPDFEQETFLTSLSEHEKGEDFLGRLSMWRAYGQGNGVALILKNTPFMADTNELKAMSAPVTYASPDEYLLKLTKIGNAMIERRDEVAALGRDTVFSCLFQMLKVHMLCTKHPGFAEEKEWRVLYQPTFEKSPVIKAAFAVIEGIPQQIHKIPLANDPANGLHSADIENILERIIIGPTKQPLTMYRAFVELLREAKITNPEGRVVISEIPLRT
ncbi:DUF2971 domain-containing protein [Caulobacter sp. DWR1-3-2b1]|uniref:DUF2971 domain-containing protein n=1 Tax=Caulobacter sp. DWR1-3-2b1 TaxID=2804670 RepID=UPI003CF2F616